MFSLKIAMVLVAPLFIFNQNGFSQSLEPLSSRVCPSPWLGSPEGKADCRLTQLNLNTTSELNYSSRSVKVFIRSGYLPENPNASFKGNIIYYEGLGDSMLNHLPLFQTLTNAGFRVIAFDYMGQGGSSGTMNDTRIPEIAALGNQIWSMHARDLQSFPKKIIIGWSTGGLAAYLQAASSTEVSEIVLIAPGIEPNMFVGEQKIWPPSLDQITLASLTTQDYSTGVENPHIDPIKPNSPTRVLSFTMNLMESASVAQNTPMPSRVQGLVLLSGKNDTYVNAEETRQDLQELAPQFLVKQYAGALHEIDNEAKPNGPQAREDILNFLLSNY